MWRGTFLPPNRSISNITGWNLVEPTSGEIPRLFWFQKTQKSLKWGPQFQGRVIPGKKRPLPGMHHTEVRIGDGHQNPNIQISRYPDVQMSGYPDIRYQIPDIRYQKNKRHANFLKWFPESQQKKSASKKLWSSGHLRRPRLVLLFIFKLLYGKLQISHDFASVCGHMLGSFSLSYVGCISNAYLGNATTVGLRMNWLNPQTRNEGWLIEHLWTALGRSFQGTHHFIRSSMPIYR